MDTHAPDKILVRGARVHNLKDIDVDIPLGRIVGIAGVSGSGKSSLALGVLYAEGSRRYLEALSTYTRRRMTQAPQARVDEVLYVPAAIALHQRPGVPGIRSTFGTGTELLASLRLMFSRLASHRCPACGHYHAPSLDVAAERELVCEACGNHFYGPAAEDLSFNSTGACKRCGGTGVVMAVDRSTLVPDPSKTIDEGAVAPWNSLMWSLMTDVCREMGVRTDVPFEQLTDREKDIVYNGPAEKKHILYRPKNSDQATELDFTYYNAVYTVENALAKVTDEKGMKRVERFLRSEVCPDCHGTRLSEAARAPRIDGIGLDAACAMTLDACIDWVRRVPSTLPEDMRPMAASICESFLSTSRRLVDLGLGYLTLDRLSSSLSGGESQRINLSTSLGSSLVGSLYILDEPSIGLHPRDTDRLIGVLRKLQGLGNTVVVVEHDEEIIRSADMLVDVGPDAGRLGGEIVYAGPVADIAGTPRSHTADYLTGAASIPVPSSRRASRRYIEVTHATEHNLRDVTARFPLGVMTAVTGVSGSGKSTLVRDILYKALARRLDAGTDAPGAFGELRGDLAAVGDVVFVDQNPIGRSSRSNAATYLKAYDEIRELMASQQHSRQMGFTAGYFSFNTEGGRCEECKGEGSVTIPMQFLADVTIPCEACGGKRFKREILEVKYRGLNISDILDLTVDAAIDFFSAGEGTAVERRIVRRLQPLHDVGLGYIKLGQWSSTMSGGENQRVKLASYLADERPRPTVFIFDEPTTGLHFHDIHILLDSFRRLIEKGHTLIIIEHNPDVIKSADHIIDMGPDGGDAGGTIVATGTPEEIAACPDSVTGRYLRPYLKLSDPK